MGDDQFTQNVIGTIRRYGMIHPGDVILMAVSGGRDSMALVRVLTEISPRFSMRLVVGHVDHGLRSESESEAEFVCGQCEKSKIPFHGICLDTQVLREDPGGIEHAARRERYKCFRKMAKEAGANKIATGHHLNDQAETVLYRALRGSGSKGLSAIRPVAGQIIRPLLHASRKMIDAYCAKHDIAYVDDSSNLDESFVRNALRLRLLPVCEEILPGSSAALARIAELRRLEDEVLSEVSAKDREAFFHEMDGGGALALDDVRKLSQGRRFLLIREVVLHLTGALPDLKMIKRIDGSISSSNPSSITEIGVGWLARRRYNSLIFQRINHEEPLLTECVLVVPGETRIKGIGTIHARVAVNRCDLEQPGPDVALLDPAMIVGRLHIRAKKEADAYQRVGSPGVQKLSDMFIDAKIPADQRWTIPIICDERGIVWIPGFGPAGRVANDLKSLPLVIVAFQRI